MKHKKAILTILAHFHESWMDDEDRQEMNRELLKAAGKTMEQLNEEIEIGVKNGHTVEHQMAIVRRLLG